MYNMFVYYVQKTLIFIVWSFYVLKGFSDAELVARISVTFSLRPDHIEDVLEKGRVNST